MINYAQLQIVKSLLLPPGLLVLLALLGLLFLRRRLGKFMLFLSMASLYLLSTPFIATELMSGLKLHPALQADAIRSDAAEAIVVLGGKMYLDAPEYGEDTIGGTMLERIRYTAWLHHRTGLPVIISGGRPSYDSMYSEAEVAAKALKQEFWVTKILALEKQSRTTWDNAVNTKEILQQLKIKKIILVTSAWHMPRAVDSFNRVGIYPIPAPTGFSPPQQPPSDPSSWLPSIDAFNDSHWALHEYIGSGWYRVREIIDHLPAGTPPRSPGAAATDAPAAAQPDVAGAESSSVAAPSQPTTGAEAESVAKSQ